MEKTEQKKDELNPERTLTKIIAFRVSKKTHKQFKKILKKSDKVKSDILREILMKHIQSTIN